MSRRLLLPIAFLTALPGCRDFAVGPEAFEPLPEDDDTCEEAGLDAGCSSFEFDNGTLNPSSEYQPVVLRMGFESESRNLEYLTVTYEQPGQPVSTFTCNFGFFSVQTDPVEPYCTAVILDGTTEEEFALVEETTRGVLSIELELPIPNAGSHGLSAWLTDDNGFESPPVRWEFTVVSLDPMNEG